MEVHLASTLEKNMLQVKAKVWHPNTLPDEINRPLFSPKRYPDSNYILLQGQKLSICRFPALKDRCGVSNQKHWL